MASIPAAGVLRASRDRVRIAQTAAALGLLLVAGFVAHQWAPYFASRRLDDPDWYRRASPAEKRAAAHSALALVFGDPHDAFVALERYGDRTSIPYLERALDHRPKDERDVVECTWVHGRRALDRALTLSVAAP